MRHEIRTLFVVLGLAAVVSAAPGSELGQPIDLSNFDRIESPWDEQADGQGEIPLEPVGYGLQPAATRLYVSGIVGASFATLATGGSSFISPATFSQRGSVNDTLFTGAARSAWPSLGHRDCCGWRSRDVRAVR